MYNAESVFLSLSTGAALLHLLVKLSLSSGIYVYYVSPVLYLIHIPLGYIIKFSNGHMRIVL